MRLTRSRSKDKGYEYENFIHITEGNISAKDEAVVTFHTCCAVYSLCRIRDFSCVLYAAEVKTKDMNMRISFTLLRATFVPKMKMWWLSKQCSAVSRWQARQLVGDSKICENLSFSGMPAVRDLSGFSSSLATRFVFNPGLLMIGPYLGSIKTTTMNLFIASFIHIKFGIWCLADLSLISHVANHSGPSLERCCEKNDPLCHLM